MRNGFTLIELSIVLIIIGLLVGGVLAGRDLISAAKLKSIGMEFNQWTTAMNTFRLKYDAIPGDMDNATSFFSGTANGDGDKLVEHGTSYTGEGEVLDFWQQLSLAGIVDGNYTGAEVSSDLAVGVNVPSSAFGKGAGWLYLLRESGGAAWDFYNRQGHYFEYGSVALFQGLNNAPSGPLLTAFEAFTLDTKIDDGSADSGFLYASNGYNSATSSEATGCAAWWSAASASYGDLSSDDPTCRLVFWHEPN